MPNLLETLFHDLRSSRKKMNGLLGVSFLFAFIAHFYIVESYFEYKNQEQALTASLREKNVQFEQLSGQTQFLTELKQKISKTLQDTREEIKGYPDHLHEMFPKIQDALSSQSSSRIFQQSMPAKVNGLTLPPEIIEFDPAVRWYINTWFNKLINKLNDEIVVPIKQAKIIANGAEGIHLQEIARQAIADIQNFLNGLDPEFWKRYSGSVSKNAASQGLQVVVEKSFGLVEEEVSKFVKGVVIKLKTVKDDLKENTKKLEDTRTLKKKLDSRINSLESPFGRIPVDLPDLMKLFPILLAGLIISITATFRKSTSLQSAFSDQLRKSNINDNDGTVLKSLADCWYLPPYSSVFHPVVFAICIAIFIGIFVRASLLVFTEPALFIPLSSKEVDILGSRLFLVAYLSGGFAILVCIWIIGNIYKTQWYKNYKNEQSIYRKNQESGNFKG